MVTSLNGFKKGKVKILARKITVKEKRVSIGSILGSIVIQSQKSFLHEVENSI